MENTFTGSFENSFGDSYMRNHKSTTVKNLRCFPRCSDNDHRDNGFCGNEVILRWTSTQPVASVDNLEAYSEFQESTAESRYQVGSSVSAADLADQVTLMRGEVSLENQLAGKITFSRETKGWHYGWMAGRGNGSQAWHEMRVYLLEKVGESEYVCRLVNKSTAFQVTSRKRVRPKKGGVDDQTSLEISPEPSKRNMDGSFDKKLKLDGDKAQFPVPGVGHADLSSLAKLGDGQASSLPSSLMGAGSGQQRNMFANIFGPGGYQISSTPPVYHPVSTTPPTYNLSNLLNSQSNILSAIGPPPSSDLELLDVLWQPTPPNSFTQILLQRQQLIQRSLEEEKEKQAQARSSESQARSAA